MSLGRAFLAAGAESVTVSLWQVSDDSTALLMERYYKGILENKKKSAALAEALRRVREWFDEPLFLGPIHSHRRVSSSGVKAFCIRELNSDAVDSHEYYCENVVS